MKAAAASAAAAPVPASRRPLISNTAKRTRSQAGADRIYRLKLSSRSSLQRFVSSDRFAVHAPWPLCRTRPDRQIGLTSLLQNNFCRRLFVVPTKRFVRRHVGPTNGRAVERYVRTTDNPVTLFAVTEDNKT